MQPRLAQLKDPSEDEIEDSFADYRIEMESRGDGRSLFKHGGLACSATRATTKGDKMYKGYYYHLDLHIFMFVAKHYPHLLNNWRTDEVLRLRLANDLLFWRVGEILLNKIGINIEDYCGRSSAHMQTARTLLIEAFKAEQRKIAAQNKLGLRFIRQRSA
jgi:hypothetical protein